MANRGSITTRDPDPTVLVVAPNDEGSASDSSGPMGPLTKHKKKHRHRHHHRHHRRAGSEDGEKVGQGQEQDQNEGPDASFLQMSSTDVQEQEDDAAYMELYNKKMGLDDKKNGTDRGLAKDSEDNMQDVGLGTESGVDTTATAQTLIPRPNPRGPGGRPKWGRHTPIQEVACDTEDTKEPTWPTFLLHFSSFAGEEFSIHIGLRRRIPVPAYIVPLTKFSPPTTDDYAREVFRYIKTQERIRVLRLVLEIHFDDDPLVYKTFTEGLEPNGDATKAPQASRAGTFWSLKTIPSGITFIHVEVPGISEEYLDDWKRLLELQKQVRTLICNFGAVLWTFYAGIVSKNTHTLEKVCLRRIVSYDVKRKIQVPFDFGIFQKCFWLIYLKITGGGYRDRWNEWRALGSRQTPEEILMHVNFELLPTTNLQEFHFSKMNINIKRLEALAEKGSDKKLNLICADCPDREYYFGDWSKPSNSTFGSSDIDVEMALLYAKLQKRHLRAHSHNHGNGGNTNRRQNTVVIVLLIFLLVAVVGMSISVGVAVYYSSERNLT